MFLSAQGSCSNALQLVVPWVLFPCAVRLTGQVRLKLACKLTWCDQGLPACARPARQGRLCLASPGPRSRELEGGQGLGTRDLCSWKNPMREACLPVPAAVHFLLGNVGSPPPLPPDSCLRSVSGNREHVLLRVIQQRARPADRTVPAGAPEGARTGARARSVGAVSPALNGAGSHGRASSQPSVRAATGSVFEKSPGHPFKAHEGTRAGAGLGWEEAAPQGRPAQPLAA